MFANNRRVVYTAVLLLFLLAFIGPWTFTRDGVPPPEYCDERFVLIDEYICAKMMSGAEILLFSLLGLPVMLFGDIFATTQNFAASELPRILLLFIFSFIILFTPLAFSSMRMIPKWQHKRHRFSSIAWGALLLLLFAVMPTLTHYRGLTIFGWFWGYGLYLTLTAVMFLTEIWGVRQQRIEK